MVSVALSPLSMSPPFLALLHRYLSSVRDKRRAKKQKYTKQERENPSTARREPANKVTTGNRDQNIQVNVLSTTLLALLLLPWMKAERANRSSPAHLSIVGSVTHMDTDIKTWNGYIAQDGGVLAHYREAKNFPDPQVMYSATKMMVHYAADELAKIAQGTDARYVLIFGSPVPHLFIFFLSLLPLLPI